MHGSAIDLGLHSLAGKLLHIFHLAVVLLTGVSGSQGGGNGMVGVAFHMGRQMQEFFFAYLLGVHSGDLKGSLGQGACFVEDHRVHLGEGFQIVGALNQHTCPAGAAETCKKGQGDADDQGAGAGDNQEDQGSVYPGAPAGFRAPNQQICQRGQESQGYGGSYHGGGVDPGKAGDKGFGFGFSGAGLADQFQNLGGGGFVKFTGGADFQEARKVHGAGDNLIPGFRLPGEAFSREGCGVQGGASLHDYAVNGDFLPGLHHNDGADFHLVRVHLLQLALLPFDVGIIRADVHKCGDVPAAFAYGVALEELAYLVEEHNGDAFGIIAIFVNCQGHGPQSGNGHQEVFVQGLAVHYALTGLVEHIIAHQQVGGQVAEESGQAGDGGLGDNENEQGREKYPLEILLLLAAHTLHQRKTSQSSSTFLQFFRTSSITACTSAPSSNSTFIFSSMKFTLASLTPGVFLAACSILSAQLAQSTSIL